MKRKRATIRDVARLAKVAPITVSRVVNNSGYISDDTRERVESAIAELNYIPNNLSQSLRFQRTNMVTLLISDVTNPFWTTVTRGVEDVCSAYDLNVILCNTDERTDKLESYVRLLLQRQTDGFILVPTSGDGELVQTIIDNRVPMVIVDRVLPGIEAPVVRGDNEDGAYRLTQHLLDLGHRSIGMIAGPRGISSSEQRIVGYRRALEDNGISVDPILIRHGDYSQPGGYKITCELLTAAVPFPTALFAANNFIALGVLQALNEAGLRVPEDVSLVGFDELATNSLQPPFLTIADQNPYAIGKEAAALLIQQINGKELHNTDVRLPVEIRVRDSTRPPRADV